MGRRRCLAAGWLLLTGVLAGCDPADQSSAPVSLAKVAAPTETSPSDPTPASGAADATPLASEPTAAQAKKPRGPRDRPLPAFGDDATRERAQPARPSLLKPAKGDFEEITFDSIKFDMQKGDPFERSLLTSQIEALHDKRVKLRGFILPSFQQSGIKEFVLVRDNMECCFGPGAALYDCVIIKMVPPRTANYTVRPVAVVGTFRISILPGPDDDTLAIYEMAGESVE